MPRTRSAGATRASLQHYRDELRAELENFVLPAVLERLEAGGAAPPPHELARRMLAVAPAAAPANKMAEQVGPEFYDTAGVMVVLALPGSEPVSRQAVAHRRKRRSVLALRTADKRWIYPTWQFVDHDVMPGLSQVMAAFGEQPAWSVATWLTTPRPELEGATALQFLQKRHDLARVTQLAKHAAGRWAA